MNEDSFYNGLIEKYLNNNSTPQEVKELFDYLKTNNSNKLLLKKIEEEFKIPKQAVGKYEDKIREQLREKIAPAKVISIKRNLWSRIAVAALVLLVLSIAGYLVITKKNERTIAENTKPAQKNGHDIAPGGNKAILTLADGSQIVLDTTGNGAITKQGGVTIIKLDGQLAYNKSNNNSTEVLYNTITTPKGGQYQLVLADGTKVWLNAASSLRFPTAFAGKERMVDLTGEGYFEVAHNAAMPFHVKVGDMDVQVLGTHFNCNAYNDEPLTAITLLEGSVKIKSGAQNVVLKEGQQARTANDKYQSGTPSNPAAISVISDADVKSVVAWKNGLFDFNNAHITDIMRQLARWYDAEVFFKGKIPERHYTGAIRKTVNLSEVIKMIELAGGVQVTINNKKMIIQER